MKRLLIALFAGMTATSAMAGIGDIQKGGSGPINVTKTMLAIKSPGAGACPAQAQMKAWIYTNKAGPVTYMMIRHGQGAGAPKVIQTKKANGLYVAEISQTLNIVNAIDAKYRIAARGAGDFRFSNWVPLKADC